VFHATTFTTGLGNTLSFTGFDPATGQVSYSYTLNHNDSHPTGNGTNSLFEDFGVVLKDIDGKTANDTLSIDVVDDVPQASQVTKSILSSGHDTNVMLVLDVSGSMDDASGVPGLTRLDVLKASVSELLDQYGDLGQVRVQIVTFSTGAQQVGSNWMTIDQAKAAVDALTAGGNTNYDAAVTTAESIYGNAGALATAGVQNVSYFMSDGVPNLPNGSVGINATEESTWTNFLNTHQIDSFALGMGSGVTQSALDPLAFNGQTNTNTSSVVVTDLSQLSQTLVSTVSHVGGNLLADGVLPNSFGADGGFIKSITVDGTTTYSYDPNAHTMSASGGPDHGAFNSATHVETINLASGGTFSLDMDDGTFTYDAPTNVAPNFSEVILWQLQDNDGDTAGNSLTIVVSTQDHPPIVRDDHVITNQQGASGLDHIVIPDFALLYNDSDPEGQAISITGVTNGTSGTVSHAGTNVTFTEDSNNAVDGGTFTYTGSTSSPTASDTGLVTVDRSQTGTTIDGTGLDDILMGRDGANNILTGNGGDDVLIAGNGNDTLDGGSGNDLMVGGTGNDTYVVDSAGDSIVENAGEGTDTVQASISYSLAANLENLTLTGSANINGTGNSLDNVITSNSGIDTLTGGAGNDTYVVNNAADVIVENAGEGTDTVQAAFSYTLGANIENLTLLGTGSINGTGNSLDNVISGTDGNNTITGGAGNDMLFGGNGNDTYAFGLNDGTDIISDTSGTDAIVVNAGGAALTGLDAIASGNNLQIAFNGESITVTNHFNGTPVESITFSGGATFNGVSLGSGAYNLPTDHSGTWSGSNGNDIVAGDNNAQSLNGGNGNDIIFGNGGDDTLEGGSGNDILVGGTGNDTYVVDSTTDTIIENVGEGTDTVQSSVTFSLASIANVENLTLTGNSSINGTGNSLDNVITGNGSKNIIDGGAGNDTIIGGDGNDTLTGGTGADHFRYTSTADGGSISNQSGADHILDFNIADGDVIEISTSAFSGLPGIGNNASGIFGSSASDTFGSSSERFHFNTATHTLLYDSNGSSNGGTQVSLAVLENGGTIDAAHILMVA